MTRQSFFEGAKELNEAYYRLGMIIEACARLEHAIAYLEWQLKAFSLPTSSQQELRAERDRWDKYARPSDRLNRATKAFDAAPVKSRIRQDPKLKKMRREWEALREQARDLGDKRNMVGHSSLSWNEGQVVREIGWPWNVRSIVSVERDNMLKNEINDLVQKVGVFTTDLGFLLPFADNDQIFTGVSA